jgi:hypothetical protein
MYRNEHRKLIDIKWQRRLHFSSGLIFYTVIEISRVRLLLQGWCIIDSSGSQIRERSPCRYVTDCLFPNGVFHLPNAEKRESVCGEYHGCLDGPIRFRREVKCS